MRVRKATRRDFEDIRGIHLSAFPEAERDLVATLATDLLTNETDPPTISLVCESDGVVAGHVAFSPVRIKGHEKLPGYILAPLAILPDQQKRGVGAMLVKEGIRELKTADASICFVYGDPDYYGRFGFQAVTAEGFTPPHPPQYPFGWQAVILTDCDFKDRPVAIRCVPALDNAKLW